jgi:hypothetical protein
MSETSFTKHFCEIIRCSQDRLSLLARCKLAVAPGGEEKGHAGGFGGGGVNVGVSNVK